MRVTSRANATRCDGKAIDHFPMTGSDMTFEQPAVDFATYGTSLPGCSLVP